MTKPNISDVAEWTLRYESDLVTVLEGYAQFPGDYWQVIPASGKAKYFYGETAWMDARRFASDIDFGAWTI